MIAKKILASLISANVSLVLWLGLILLQKNSTISLLQKISVYISHLSFIGWIIFGVLSIGIYSILSKKVLN